MLTTPQKRSWLIAWKVSLYLILRSKHIILMEHQRITLQINLRELEFNQPGNVLIVVIRGSLYIESEFA